MTEGNQLPSSIRFSHQYLDPHQHFNSSLSVSGFTRNFPLFPFAWTPFNESRLMSLSFDMCSMCQYSVISCWRFIFARHRITLLATWLKMSIFMIHLKHLFVCCGPFGLLCLAGSRLIHSFISCLFRFTHASSVILLHQCMVFDWLLWDLKLQLQVNKPWNLRRNGN